MNFDDSAMDDATPPTNTYTVEVEGCFGSVSWTLPKHLWDIMPTTERQNAAQVAGSRKIAPYFTAQVERLLKQVGKDSIQVSSLDPGWSFHTVEMILPCSGAIYWQVSQGVWDALPDDQRDTLLDFSKVLIHAFFEREVVNPLGTWATRRLHG